MSEDLLKMLETVDDHERRCDACKHQNDGCAGGVTGGPNGPIYPPCSDLGPEEYIDEDLLKEVYDEITEDEEA